MVRTRHGRYNDAFTARQDCGCGSGIGIPCTEMARTGNLSSFSLQQALGMCGGDPTALLRDADGDDFALLLVDRVEDGRGRQKRDLVLAATPAKQHSHPKFFHDEILIPESRS